MTLQEIANYAMDYLDSMNIPASYEINYGLNESPSLTVIFHETRLRFNCQCNYFGVANSIRCEVSKINRLGVGVRCFSKL